MSSAPGVAEQKVTERLYSYCFGGQINCLFSGSILNWQTILWYVRTMSNFIWLLCNNLFPSPLSEAGCNFRHRRLMKMMMLTYLVRRPKKSMQQRMHVQQLLRLPARRKSVCLSLFIGFLTLKRTRIRKPVALWSLTIISISKTSCSWVQKSANLLAKFAPSYHLMNAFIAFSCIYAHLAIKQIVEVRLYDLRNFIANCDLLLF